MLYCLIYNLNSSAGRKSKFINKVLSKLKKNNSVDYFETNTISQAKKIFKDFNKKNYDRLIVAGGDGSVSFAINELIKNDFNFKDDFAIGYIPAGTANLLQAELSMNKKVDDIVDVLVSNNYKTSNLLKINESFFFLAVNEVSAALSGSLLHLFPRDGMISFLKKFLSKSLSKFVSSSTYGKSFL